MQTIAFNTSEVVVTPAVTASSAYSSGQQVGGIQTLANVCITQARIAQLLTFSVIDIDNQKAPLVVFLFNQNPTVTSVDGGTFAITAANFKSQLVGSFSISAADYVSAASKANAAVNFSNSFFNNLDPNGSLYAALVTTGTPTYTSTSSLVCRWVFAKHF